MSDYPYLAAVLPSLEFGDVQFPSSERFMDEAEKWLAEDELRVLSSAHVDDYAPAEHSLELLDEYNRFERSIRRDIAVFVEARRSGHDHKTNMFPTSYLKDTTPLEAARRLLRLRWDFVQSRLDTHYGDLHSLVIYRIKIQILERLAGFEKAKGTERFSALTDSDSIAVEVVEAS